MKRNVSPVFAVIVILFALVVGAMYFLRQYRTEEVMRQRQMRGLQAQMQQSRESGEMEARQQRMGENAATRSRAGRGAGEARQPASEGKDSDAKSEPTGK